MKKLASLALLLASCAALSAQSLSISALPALEIPLGSSADLFSIGGGADLSAAYSLKPEGGLRLSGAAGYRALSSLASSPLSLASLAVGLGWQARLGQRIAIAADARGGAYLGSYEGTNGIGPMAAADAGASLNLGQGFSLGLGVSGAYFLAGTDPLYSGLGVRLALSFAPGSGSGKAAQPKLRILDAEFQPIFPVFYKWYDANPVGSLTISNKESRPIKNVRASIFIKEFMDAPKVFAEIPELGKGESRQVPVLALLIDKVLGVTESMKVAAEITVSYDLADEQLTATRVETLRVLDRNAMAWSDDRRAASFVTARDPAVLALAKGVAGTIREAEGAGSELELRIAMGMYQALGLYGIKYVVDPASSYSDLSKQVEATDYLQFPRQTLQFKSGDCDDLSILYAALMESVGIEAAFITVPGHILAAVALPLSPEEAARTFSRQDRYLVDGEKVYIPVEATMFSKGFNAAWAEGARQWKLAGAAARLIPVREAWKTYEAVGLRDDPPALEYPSAKALTASYSAEMKRFVSEELGPQVARIQDEIDSSGSTSKNLNRLGVLYARYGKYAEAEVEFKKVVKKEEYVPALINLGNLSYLKNDKKTAASLYDRAIKKDPYSKAALSGAIRARGELGETAAAAKYLASLRAIDPKVAESLETVGSTQTGASRASAAGESRVYWNEE